MTTLTPAGGGLGIGAASLFGLGIGLFNEGAENEEDGDFLEEGDESEEYYINSAGEKVRRKYVEDEDELLDAANRAAGGSLDDYENYKPNWWQSSDGKRRIEWNPDGHANTNEGPHVTVRDFDGRRHSVKEKYFIKGRDKFK